MLPKISGASTSRLKLKLNVELPNRALRMIRILQAISTYAQAYKQLEVVQRANPALLPRGDQKTGVIAEFYGRLYAAERFAPAKPEFGSTSEHAWDIKVQQPNGAIIKIQIKAVSAHAEKSRISTIHPGWDELWLMRLTEEMLPEAFWIYKKNNCPWAVSIQKSKTMPQLGKPGTGSIELRNGEDRLTDLLAALSNARRESEESAFVI